jgi:hypothetical protein
LRLPVGCSSYAAPGRAQQTADGRPSPGIVVVDGGPQAGSQEPTQTRAVIKRRVLIVGCGASRKKTQTQQTYNYQTLSQAQAPKALSRFHDFSLPKDLVGPFDYLEAPRRKTLRPLRLQVQKKIASGKIIGLQKVTEGNRYGDYAEIVWCKPLWILNTEDIKSPFSKGGFRGIMKELLNPLDSLEKEGEEKPKLSCHINYAASS